NQGDHITVRVRAVNAYGASQWAEVTHIVVLAADLPIDTVPPIPNVTGLELYEQGNDTNFSGRDAKVCWRDVSLTAAWEFGNGEVQHGARDTYFRDYQVTMRDPASNRILRVEY